jgi:hypothetical protein
MVLECSLGADILAELNQNETRPIPCFNCLNFIHLYG